MIPLWPLLLSGLCHRLFDRDNLTEKECRMAHSLQGCCLLWRERHGGVYEQKLLACRKIRKQSFGRSPNSNRSNPLVLVRPQSSKVPQPPNQRHHQGLRVHTQAAVVGAKVEMGDTWLASRRSWHRTKAHGSLCRLPPTQGRSGLFCRISCRPCPQLEAINHIRGVGCTVDVSLALPHTPYASTGTRPLVYLGRNVGARVSQAHRRFLIEVLLLHLKADFSLVLTSSSTRAGSLPLVCMTALNVT